MNRPVVILGAGYGGLMTAVKLEEKTRSRDDVEIILIDQNPYHQYVHLAYEIVTGNKKVSDLTLPMTELIANKKIRFVQATVNGIDTHNEIVKTDKGDITYSRLVIALGNEPNFYNIKGADKYSLTFNSVKDANKIHDELEKIASQNKNFNVTIGGGGFTGVELAGEILDEYHCCVTIIEGTESLLPSWKNPEFSKKVASVLSTMGAKLILDKRIVEVAPHSITLNDGSQIESALFIWTAGVQASSIVKSSGLKTTKGNRAAINEFCSMDESPNIYVIGDSALVVDANTRDVLPQCIEIALQQAETVAANIVADLDSAKRSPYQPKFNGLILAVGETYGIGRIYGVNVEGRIAQMVKRVVHLQYVYEIAGLKEVMKEAL